MLRKLLFLLAFAAPLAAAQKPDPALLARIRDIRAIDDHSHPPALPLNGVPDDEYDALLCAPLESTDPTITGRPENPRFIAAWRALYGYKYDDMAPAHVRELLAAKTRIKKEQGDNYPAWVLDRLGIETELVNREAMGPGLKALRFRWVPFDDALLLPLDNSNLAAETPDRKFFYGRENQLLQRYLKTLNKNRLPARLGDYLSQIVTPTWKIKNKMAPSQ